MPRKAKDTAPAGTTSTAKADKSEEQAKPKSRRKRAMPKARAAPVQHRRVAVKPTPKPSRGRRGVRYSDAERAKILATAKREGLTGAQVRDRFGVSMLTYYTWRKKAASLRRARHSRSSGQDGDVAAQIRAAIRAQVRAMLPRIIEQEIGSTLRGR